MRNLPIPLIPAPARMVPGEGQFSAASGLRLCLAGDHAALQRVARHLGSLLAFATENKTEVGDSGVNVIVLRLDAQLPISPEGYIFESSPERIVITGSMVQGVFHGIQTLRQLLPAQLENGPLPNEARWTIPSVIIHDEPRFEWRGAMVDSGRHFFPVEELKRFLDVMALHKLNVFHWHLTEDQGWRIEIKKYPKLTEIGAWRAESPAPGNRDAGDGKRYGGFYTQEEIRAVVAYAADRFITIIPEIEMPGHSGAAIAAYPEFGNSDISAFAPSVLTRWGVNPYTYAPREETFRFLEDVLSEVMELFPSTYIHIGGDEAPKDQWKESPFAQDLIKKEQLADEHELQSWFIRRIERFLNDHGRRLIGWDEIQEGGLSQNATMMVWRDWNWARFAIKRGNPVVMSPTTHCYLDYPQADPNSGSELESFGEPITVEKTYSLDPVPPGLEAGQEKLVLGVQGNLWTEFIWDASHLQYMAFPRLSALAEVGWSPLAAKDYSSFCRRLPPLLERFDAMGINYRKLER